MTWNVRTLKSDVDLFVLLEIMCERKIDIMAVQETRRYDFYREQYYWTQNWRQKTFTICASGCTQANDGVALILSPRAAASWKAGGQQISGWRHRILEICLKTKKHGELWITTVHAPTDCSRVNDAKQHDEFFDKLEARIKATPKRQHLIMLGDFNARVGRDADNWPGVIGPYDLKKVNTNGEQLRDLCSEYNLSVVDTFFRQKLQGTWLCQINKKWYPTDHVITRQKHRLEVTKVKIGRQLHLNTDHRPICIYFRAKLLNAANKTKSLPAPKAAAMAMRRSPENQRLFEKKMDKLIAHRRRGWTASLLESKLKEAAETMPTQTTVSRTAEWINNEVIKACDAKRRDFNALETARERNDHLTCDLTKQYKQSRSAAKIAVKAAKIAYMTDLAERAEEAARNNDARELFTLAKAIRPPKPQCRGGALKDENGRDLKSEVEQLQRWTRYFDDLLNPDTVPPLPPPPPPANATDNNTQPSSAIPDNAPTVLEITAAIKSLRANKSGGSDGIPPELLKYGGNRVILVLYWILQKAWDDKELPPEWDEALVVPLFKKGDRSEPTNYRGITLLCAASKVASKIIQVRLANALDASMSECQYGFRKGRGTNEMLFAARLLVEKGREHRQPLYWCFVDFHKAYDCVKRDKLWQILEDAGVPPTLLEIAKKCHQRVKMTVQVNGKKAEDSFLTQSGVRQGCVLSPLLFNIAIDYIIKKLLQTLPEAGVNILRGQQNRRKLVQPNPKSEGEELLRLLQFADDIGIVAESENELRQLVEQLSVLATEIGLRINTKKTVVMVTSYKNTAKFNDTIRVDDTALEVVDEFVYLGGIIGSEKGVGREISERIAKATRAFHAYKWFWRRQEIDVNTRIRVFNAIIMGVLLYGCVSWTPRKPQFVKLERFQCRCLRTILGLHRDPGSFLLPSNSKVLTKAKATSMALIIQQRRLKWYGHICRMSPQQIPQFLMFGRLTSKRPRCGVEQRWLDRTSNNLLRWGLNWERAFETTAKEWNALVEDNTPAAYESVVDTDRNHQCEFCDRPLTAQGKYNHERFCRKNPRRIRDSRVATSERRTCPECSKSIDPRGYKNHVKSCRLKQQARRQKQRTP